MECWIWKKWSRIQLGLFGIFLLLQISCQVNAKAKEIAIPLDPKAILKYQDQKDRYWLVHEGEGIYLYQEGVWKLFTKEDGLVSSRIISIQEDAEGRVYFDSPDGIFRYNDFNFERLKPTLEEHQDKMWRSNPTDLWFSHGWNHVGPLRFDGKQLYQLTFPENPRSEAFFKKYPNVSYNPYGLYTIYKDRQNNIWFGTADMGIYHWDGTQLYWCFDESLTTTPNGGAFGIRSIVQDEEDYYWICTASKKFRVEKKPSTDFSKHVTEMKLVPEKAMSTNNSLYFLDMAKSSDGAVWFVSYDEGVFRKIGDQWEQFEIKVHQEQILLNSLYIDRLDRVWLASLDHGLYYFDGRSFLKMDKKKLQVLLNNK